MLVEPRRDRCAVPQSVSTEVLQRDILEVAEEMARTNLSTPTDSLPSALAPHDWDFAGACFFCFTAATTIGFGNYTPQTDGGKAFLILYAFISVPACLSAFAEISDGALEMLARRFHSRMGFEKRIRQAFSMFDAEYHGSDSEPPAEPPARPLNLRLNRRLGL